MALKAFATTANYDATIYKGLFREVGAEEGPSENKIISLHKIQNLRYGENPHQKAEYFLPTLEESPFEQFSGKELSYNNLLDLDTLLRGCSIFQDNCACVIVKHTTPCGTAKGNNSLDAFRKALDCDPISAFGNNRITRSVDMETASAITETSLK